MNFVYAAHIPLAIVFLLFVVCFVVVNGRRRSP